MQIFDHILTVIAIIVALVFVFVVFITGKGDAMSGGGSGVRTSFKGKASFDDIMSRLILGFGIGFMVLMIVLNLLGNELAKK